MKYLYILLFFSSSLFAQTTEIDTLILQNLDEVSVSATRIETKDINTPLAITAIGQFNLQNTQQQLSINDALNTVPGVLALNAENFAQDLRVSIRGFGARSAFGIRGVKILVDGLPESTPDGQGQVDNLDLGLLQKMEIIRGPASGLYGNASGGVISFLTEELNQTPFVELRATAGSYGFQQYQFKTAQNFDKLQTLFHANYTSTNGYRDQSGMRNLLLNGKINWQLKENTSLKILINYANSPKADDPGSLNADAVAEDRRQARDRNLLFQTGETVTQARVGAILTQQFKNNDQFVIKSYFGSRDFENKLPFEGGGQVDLRRTFVGTMVSYDLLRNLGNTDYRLKVGIDGEFQADRRVRFDNIQGERGDTTLNQLEAFNNIGLYVLQTFDFSNDLVLNAAARFDFVYLRALDDFFRNGDDSGSQNLTNFSPTIGVLYPVVRNVNVYGNVATSFETPSLSELSNDPGNSGGFNPDLKPQKSVNYEVGIKGVVSKKLRYDLALFRIDVQDEIVPYEIEAFPGRSFYRNAGASQRTGVEAALSFQLMSGLTSDLVYTYSDFVYKDYETNGNNLDGNSLPGIPVHSGFARLQYLSPKGFYASLQARYVGKLYANDANTTEDDAYTVVNWRMGYQVTFNKIEIEPFLGLNNLLNEKYNSNIRINAFGSRFFEPAAEFNFYGGVRCRF